MTYFSMSYLTRSSAQRSFTTEFGMGSGGSRALRSPGKKGGVRKGNKNAPKAWVLAGQAARSISTGRLHTLLRVHRHAYLRCGLQRTFRSLKDSGEFILGKASRLDAFSGYPVRT